MFVIRECRLNVHYDSINSVYMGASKYGHVRKSITLCTYAQQGHVFDHISLCTYICPQEQ